MIRGIDASVFQNVIDWARVKQSGQVQFAFARASDGSAYADPDFERNHDVAKMRGIPIGAYHFYRAAVPWHEQDGFFFKLTQDRLGTLIPMIDVEEQSFDGASLSPDAVADEILAFTHSIIAACGLKTMLFYTNWDTWNKYLAGMSSQRAGALGLLPLWVAQTISPNSGLFGPWSDWVLWQDATMNVPGISGAVDLDLLNPKHTLEDITR